MSLPRIDLPTYDFEIPSTGKKIKFRPFSVKEQKLLLMANESKDETYIYGTIKQVIENCILTKGFEAENFASFDLEYFFLQLRSKSVGEKVTLNYKCNNEVDGKSCDAPIKIEYDLNNLKLEKPKKNANKIFFNEKVGVIMRYPGLDIVKIVATNGDQDKKDLNSIAFDMIVNCVQYIFDGDKIHDTKDIPKDELEEFIERLPSTEYEKLIQFFADIPSVKAEIEQDCPKCGFHHQLKLEGLTNFFE